MPASIQHTFSFRTEDLMTNLNNYGKQSVVPYTLGNLLGSGTSGSVYALAGTSGPAGSQTAEECIKLIDTMDLLTEKDRRLADCMGPACSEGIHRSLRKVCEKEARIMDLLKECPHVVRITGHTVCERPETGSFILCIRMEKLIPLKEYLEMHPISANLAVRLGMDICKALSACKEHHIVHQDIKADNLFVSQDDCLKLGDFGLAGCAGKKDLLRRASGTISTMAPEVYNGEKATYASDLYSLGMVLYRLLNEGRDPYIPSRENQNVAACRQEALFKRMQPGTLPLPSCAPANLGEVICKACAYDPNDRYSSPEEMAQALYKALTQPSGL